MSNQLNRKSMEFHLILVGLHRCEQMLLTRKRLAFANASCGSTYTRYDYTNAITIGTIISGVLVTTAT